MFVTEDVNLPETLINAQREKALAIFAGAGVSMGKPSNLPNFERLANKIAGRTLVREENEPIDRFVSRLKTHGVEVHRRARDIINTPESKPTPLHRALILLFSSPEELRIVTTNFDRHFSTVVEDLFKNNVETYYAPALPLGKKFDGLVYLHGSVDKEPESLILTDSDFGRAYLTEGWATQFLKEMFEKYTVLFVGYSHDDPVMCYLARGLMPDTKRYAMTKPGHDKDWKYLGIIPVNYPLKKGPNRYKALNEAIVAWAKLAKMGSLDHEQRIREIVKLPPPLNQDDADYIKGALKNLSMVRFFARYACTPDWLRWAEREQAFSSLFKLSEHIDDVSREIAVWFAKYFVCEYPNEALALVQRQGQRLNIVLWQAIIAELLHHDPPPDSETLARWMSILLSSFPPISQQYFLDFLLKNCRYPKDKITAILLFEYLTRPHLKLEPSLSFTKKDDAMIEQVDVNIVVELSEYQLLKESWEKLFKPNLEYFYTKLEPIISSHLIQANLLLRAMVKADDQWDKISFRRSAIELHEQNHYREKLDMLIDAARDIIEWMLKHEHDRALAVIDSWSTSGIPILKRLAIHGMTESLEVDSDKKITWILEKDWLYGSGMKHEIFRLLKKAYRDATESTRLRLLEKAILGRIGKSADNLKEQTRKYEIYNLLVWLSQADPKCSLVVKNLKEMQKAHPDFKPREYSDLDVVSSVGWVGPQSPSTIEELLEKDLKKEIDWLLAYQGDKFMGPDREGLLVKVTEAVTKNFEWSWKLVVVLQEKEEWDSDVWKSIFSGWGKSFLKENQWKEVLNFIAEHEQLYNFTHELADLLNEGMKKDREGLPFSCLTMAENIANKLYDSCIKVESGKEKLEYGDWLIEAINHPGGKIGELWLLVLSKRRAEEKESWIGLPNKYKQTFEKVLSGKSLTAQMGRVIFASQLHFLYYLDADWTSDNILPLLDWSTDQRQAQQAWQGYLAWGRWNEALLPRLLPLYEKSFSRLETELSSMHDRFCEHLAGIAVFSSSNPMEDGWLRNFLLRAAPKNHKIWANSIGQQLLNLSVDSAHNLWNRWMNDYWSERITGVPLPLSEDEKVEMVKWAIPLESVFPAVVEKICAIPAPSLKQTYLYRRLVEKKFASKHAKPLTKLLQHLLSSACEPFYHCKEVDELVRSLVGSGAPPGELLQVCDDMARLGCPTGSKLKELVEGKNSR